MTEQCCVTVLSGVGLGALDQAGHGQQGGNQDPFRDLR